MCGNSVNGRRRRQAWAGRSARVASPLRVSVVAATRRGRRAWAAAGGRGVRRGDAVAASRRGDGDGDAGVSSGD